MHVQKDKYAQYQDTIIVNQKCSVTGKSVMQTKDLA